MSEQDGSAEPIAESEDRPTEGPETSGDPEGREEREQASPEDVSATAEEFVSGLLEAMGLDAEVSTTIEEGRAVVQVSGPDLGILIGRRGQTLDALQEVTRTAVQRKLRSHARLLVDVENYRGRRRASLAEYAKEMAARAIERGTEIELEAMNAYERKIVHDAVGEIDGASSFSEGEEPNRKVVVRGE